MKTSAPTTSHGFQLFHNAMLIWNCAHLYSKCMVYCWTIHSVLAFILIQYTDSLTCSHVFSIPIWLLCNWSNICFSNAKGIIIHLVFIATPSNVARSCLIGQYLPKTGSNSSLFCSHSLLMSVYSICSSVFSLVADLMSSINMETGISTAVFIVCIFMLIPAISLSLFSVWLWQDIQSTINRSRPGLYIGPDQACVISRHCTGEYTAWCIVPTVTGLQHHC